MNASTPMPAMNHARKDLQIAAADGLLLSGTWFVPDSEQAQPVAVVVVAGGGGVPARRYHHLAAFLARRGLATLTFDYRGIGASRYGSLRGFKAGCEHWGLLDFGAALGVAAATFPRLPLTVVAHSVGGLFVGAAPNAPELSRVVFFGPHTGYYGDYRKRWRWLLYGVWHVMMPPVTKIVGYFPGRALHLGEDLPREFALDWARRRQPALLASIETQRRFATILDRYKEVRAKALVISVTDDAFAPPEAGRRLIAIYPNMIVTHEIVKPAATGGRRLGHFSFLRRSSAIAFWETAAAWLLQPTTDIRKSNAAKKLSSGNQTKGSDLVRSNIL